MDYSELRRLLNDLAHKPVWLDTREDRDKVQRLLNALPGLLDEIERLQVARCDFQEDHSVKRIAQLETALRKIADFSEQIWIGNPPQEPTVLDCRRMARAALDATSRNPASSDSGRD